MKNPEISVIIPFRNATNTLRRAIDSILNQTFRNFELILINDGSDDHPIDILSDYDDPRSISDVDYTRRFYDTI